MSFTSLYRLDLLTDRIKKYVEKIHFYCWVPVTGHSWIFMNIHEYSWNLMNLFQLGRALSFIASIPTRWCLSLGANEIHALYDSGIALINNASSKMSYQHAVPQVNLINHCEIRCRSFTLIQYTWRKHFLINFILHHVHSRKELLSSQKIT